jgi:hypothetical protein
MPRWIRNTLLLVAPFLMMVIVNELVRPTITEQPYSAYGFTAMNPLLESPEKCSWQCHDNTTYCKQHHVVYLDSWFQVVDPIYFGIIRALKSTGNYGAANLVVFVILLPLLMFWWLVRSLNMQAEISRLKRKQ